MHVFMNDFFRPDCVNEEENQALPGFARSHVSSHNVICLTRASVKMQ